MKSFNNAVKKLVLFSAALLLVSTIILTGGFSSKAAEQGTDPGTQTTAAATRERKIVFVGDSRTVDMFSAVKTQLKGKKRDNMYVYAMDGGTYEYMVKVLRKVDLQKGDILVSWMGCNDRGDFSHYKDYYNKLRKRGVNLIIGTIGYSDVNGMADEGDYLYYNNWVIQEFNRDLKKWAKKKGVKTIDLYTYTVRHVQVDQESGIHYDPKPTKKMWKYIVKKVNKIVAKFDAAAMQATA